MGGLTADYSAAGAEAGLSGLIDAESMGAISRLMQGTTFILAGLALAMPMATDVMEQLALQYVPVQSGELASTIAADNGNPLEGAISAGGPSAPYARRVEYGVVDFTDRLGRYFPFQRADHYMTRAFTEGFPAVAEVYTSVLGSSMGALVGSAATTDPEASATDVSAADLAGDVADVGA